MAEVISTKKKGKRRASEAAGEDAAVAAPSSTADAEMAVDGEAPAAKKSKKEKKSKAEDDVPVDPSTLSPLAHPLANRKLAKHVLRAVKKGSKQRHIRRGVKEVVKNLRKGEKGLVVMAADISPHDVLSHIPVLCEESDCPYIFVPSKELLGQASSTKRPTSCVMVVPEMRKGGKKVADPTDAEKLSDLTEFRESYAEVCKEVEAVDVHAPSY